MTEVTTKINKGDINGVYVTDAFVSKLKDTLMGYFEIGDSYVYNLTRVKEAFQVGTMSLADFVEWDEDNIDDLVRYILYQMGMKTEENNG